MIEIRNPFDEIENNESYNCFGCSKRNNAGLHLRFWLDGEAIVAKWQPEKQFEGWAGILHGGIQATLMDEAASWMVFVCIKTAGLTTELSTRYLKPVYLANGQITIRATLLSFSKRMAKIACSLEDGNGLLCSTSEITYFCFPESIARSKYNYPGANAFIGKEGQPFVSTSDQGDL